jgi:hypothetical protein
MGGAEAVHSGAKSLYHLMHAVQRLVTTAMWTHVHRVATREPQSCLDPTRHVALLVVGSAFDVTPSAAATPSLDPSTPFVAFARVLEETTAAAHPPSVDSRFAGILEEEDEEAVRATSHLPPIAAARKKALEYALLDGGLRGSIVNGSVPFAATLGASMTDALHVAVEKRQRKLRRQHAAIAAAIAASTNAEGGVTNVANALRTHLFPSDETSDPLLDVFQRARDVLSTTIGGMTHHAQALKSDPSDALDEVVNLCVEGGALDAEGLDDSMGGHQFLHATPARARATARAAATSAAFARMPPLGWLHATPLDHATGHVLDVIKTVRTELLQRGPCYLCSGFDPQTGMACYLVSWEREGNVVPASDETRAQRVANILKQRVGMERSLAGAGAEGAGGAGGAGGADGADGANGPDAPSAKSVGGSAARAAAVVAYSA